MRHLTFTEQPPENGTYDVAILIKPSAFNETEIIGNYVDPMELQGIPRDQIIAFTLDYDSKGKVTATQCKNYLERLLPALASIGVKYIYCADAMYYKTLTKQTKADPFFGYVKNVAIKDYEYIQTTIGLNYASLVYNPNQYVKLDLSIQSLCTTYSGTYKALGENIIEYEDYPNTPQKIEWTLAHLSKQPVLTCDIEAFSLKFYDAGIGTIGFSWNKHEGVAFPVECQPTDIFSKESSILNRAVGNTELFKRLRHFFEAYRGKLIFHNAAYDIKALIYALWMKHPQDYAGMLHGLNVLTRNFEDTKIIAYLALNSTAGNELGLKALAHDYAGNWAHSDIADICRIPMDDLLRYNLVDCLSTFHVFEKYYPKLVADKQEKLYRELFLPTLKVIIQMELHGMPMDSRQVKVLEQELLADKNEALGRIRNSQWVHLAEKRVQLNELARINATLKTKQHTIDKVTGYKFNPNSNHHLAVLLYEVMSLPVLEKTPSRQPATGAAVLEKLKNHTDDPSKVDLLEALFDLAKVEKIISAFLPNFLNAVPRADGRSYLYGNFNLGGTVSGRLSSSGPNLQQLPSGSIHGKKVKKAFKAPEGKIFCGADFNSLEDYISALTTKDPNKLKVYIEGYDGHCLRAFYYFGDQMPDIVDTVESINSIKKKYPHLRQQSKAPTFALTYGGTWMTLVKNCGFSEAEAKAIEANYHRMYAESDAWVQAKIQEACKTGYVEVAFGLRVRTPLLKQSVLGNSKTMREAEAEGRTAGNALGQSYGLLNNRAAVAFMERVWASDYKLDIMPVALIHDAIYLVIKDDIEVVSWVNKNLTECMSWQELPEIQHDTVKIGAELGLFHPDWSNEITLPPVATETELLQICKKGHRDYMAEQLKYKEAA